MLVIIFNVSQFEHRQFDVVKADVVAYAIAYVGQTLLFGVGVGGEVGFGTLKVGGRHQVVKMNLAGADVSCKV